MSSIIYCSYPFLRKVWDLQAQIIISYEISRVDDRMHCEVASYGGLLGARSKKKKLLTADW